MSQLTRRAWFKLAALAPVAGALVAPEAKGGASRQVNGFHAGYFPNVVLHTHEDKELRFYDYLLKNKIVVINFMYATCEGICPLVTANLVQVQKLLGDRVGRDIFMYSLTLKPEVDTPAVLHQHATQLGVGPGWWFLTGKPADIELIRRKFGIVDLDPVVDADKSQHTGMVRIGNEALERWSGCPGQAKPKVIVQTILWMQGPQVRVS